MNKSKTLVQGYMKSTYNSCLGNNGMKLVQTEED